MLTPLPQSQEDLLRLIRRREVKTRFRALAVYIPFYALVSFISPLWLLAFLGVAVEGCVALGCLSWLVMACLYFWGPEDLGSKVLGFWAMWAAMSYLIGLVVMLCRFVRVLLPWEPKAAKAMTPDETVGEVPVITRPDSVPVEWRPGDSGHFMFAHFAVQVDAPGYHAFELVVENPPADVSMDIMCDVRPQQEKEEQVELRSVIRTYGRFQPGLFHFFLFMHGSTAPAETLFTQLK